MEPIFLSPEQKERLLHIIEEQYSNSDSAIVLQILHAVRGPGIVQILYPTRVPELDEEILLLLNDEDAFNLCQINKYTANLCRNNSLWLRRIHDRFGAHLAEYLGDKTAREVYIELIRAEKDKCEFLGTAILGNYTPLVKVLPVVNLSRCSQYYFYRISDISDPELLEYLLTNVKYRREDIYEMLRNFARVGKLWAMKIIFNFRKISSKRLNDLLSNLLDSFARRDNLDGVLFLIDRFDLDVLDVGDTVSRYSPAISAYLWSQDPDDIIYGIGKLFDIVVASLGTTPERISKLRVGERGWKALRALEELLSYLTPDSDSIVHDEIFDRIKDNPNPSLALFLALKDKNLNFNLTKSEVLELFNLGLKNPLFLRAVYDNYGEGFFTKYPLLKASTKNGLHNLLHFYQEKDILSPILETLNARELKKLASVFGLKIGGDPRDIRDEILKTLV